MISNQPAGRSPIDIQGDGGIDLGRIALSVVLNARSDIVQKTNLRAVLNYMRGEETIDGLPPLQPLLQPIAVVYKDCFEKSGPNGAKKAIAPLKQNLPAAIFSGVFDTRTEPSNHSGLLCLDLDELGDRIERSRKIVEGDPHTLAVFLSPSGQGLKVLVRVRAEDRESHLAAFTQVELYYRATLGLKVDPACKDMGRLCFLAGPVLFENPGATDEWPTIADSATGLEGAGQSEPRSRRNKRVMELADGLLPDGFTDEARQVKRALEQIDPSDQNVWLECCMALKGTWGEAAWPLADEWSRNGANYDAEENRRRWESFGDPPAIAGLTSSIGLPTIFAYAKGGASIALPGKKKAEGAKANQELAFSDLLAAELPPIKTIGREWFVFESGLWQPKSHHQFRPIAQRILPPNVRTDRMASRLLAHLEGRFQVPQDQLLGFYQFESEGAVLLNANNGIIRVTPEGVSHLPHSERHLFTRQAKANYQISATCPVFQKTLSELLPDMEDQKLLQLFCGNCLLPSSRFEIALCGYGEGGSGKSTLAESLAAPLGTDLVSSLRLIQLCDKNTYFLSKLRYAALNLGTELDAIEISDSSVLKTLISGEQVEVRPIYESPFTMVTPIKFLFLANALPRFRNGTDAEYRRFRFLHFGINIQPERRDVSLKHRLAAEIDGIFSTFMVPGLQRLLTISEFPAGGKTSNRCREIFRGANDPVATFVHERCRIDRSFCVLKEDLTAAFRNFCDTRGLPQTLEAQFFKSLYERFPVQSKRKRLKPGAGQVGVVDGIRVEQPEHGE